MRKHVIIASIFCSALFISQSSTIVEQFAFAQTAQESAEADPFADFDDVEVAEVETVASGPDYSLTTVFGRLHPMLVHFPIAWLTLWVIAELLALLLGTGPQRSESLLGSLAASTHLDRLIDVRGALALLSLLSFAPGVTTGLVRATQVEVEPLVIQHRNLMLLAMVLSAVVTALYFRLSKTQGVLRFVPTLALLVTYAVMSYGAHLGGQLTYGTTYLPF